MKPLDYFTRANVMTVFVVVVCALAAYLFFNRPSNEPGAVTIAKPAPEVKYVDRIVKQAPKVIYVYPDSVKEKLHLPESVQAEKSTVVVASSRVEPGDNPRTITTTMNSDTGVFETFERVEPLPWFAIDAHGEASIGVGLKHGQPSGRLSISQNLVQVKKLRIQATATIDQDGETYAGVGVAYRW